MNTPKELIVPIVSRALILVVPAALSFAACSSDDDEPDVSLPEVSLPDVSLPDVSLPDLTLPDVTLPDVSLPDLTLPDVSLPDITLPEGVTIPANGEAAARRVLEGLGLDDEQIDCLLEQLDGQVPDVNDVMGLLEECGIELSDLQPGG